MPTSSSRIRRALMLCAVTVLAMSVAPAEAKRAAPQIEHVRVPSHDGVELDGWLVRPAGLPAEAKLPIVLWSGPYFGNGAKPGDDAAMYDNSDKGEAVPVNLLLDNGYAVAIFNVRGTGNSGGCFTWFGPDEQKDQAFLVEWLAAQSWSNGNVGMMGLSYDGTTPWEAAIENPPHLKTIVTAGMISDPYLFGHTPQGATLTDMATGFWTVGYPGQTSLVPPYSGSPQHGTVEHAPVVPERACEDVATYMASGPKNAWTDHRDSGFWDERRLIDRFHNVRAAVLLVDGFQDNYGSGHQIQANEVWNRLPNASAKQMLIGQWAHSFPNYNDYNASWPMKDWNKRLLVWLDYWLKGVGKRPRSVVSYQGGRFDGAATAKSSKLPAPAPPWRTVGAWPPPARNEVLYLAPRTLAGSPSSGSTSFRSYAVPRTIFGGVKDLLCDSGAPEPDGTRAGVAFISAPVTRRVDVAGNPFAYLKLSSDLPGGLVAVDVFDIGPDIRCDHFLTTGVRGVKYWSAGTADLRFHKGNYTGEPFPTGTPTHVRVDLTDLAETLEPGHQLAVVLSRGERMGAPYAPNITVHADGGATASHIVLPVVSGTLGGRAPKVAYPPRPFLPPRR